jgi:parallel beta-helix repeat protein
MNLSRLIPFLILFLLILALGSATQMDSASFNQTKTAQASGGESISSTNFVSAITIGQLIGQADSTNYNNTFGFQADGYSNENILPILSGLVLNATDSPTNSTNANLTAWPSFTDDDGDNISYAWDWRKENVSIAVLNMNFDVNNSAGSGETKDYTTYSNNATLGSSSAEPTWSASAGWNSTGAYEFDGNDIIVLDDGSLASFGLLSDELTVAAWFKTSSDGVIIAKTPFEFTGRMPFFVDVYGDKLRFAVRDDDAVFRYIQTSSSYTDDVWHHVVATRVGTNLSLFVDGVLANSTIDSNINTDMNHSTATVIGAVQTNGAGTYTAHFTGVIDGVFLSDQALGSEQIFALYNNRSDLIVSDETSIGENWSVCVTPNDGTVDGSEVCSNEVEIHEALNSAPSGSVSLNATDSPTNSTNANLTAWPSFTDDDGDNIGYAWDWRKENVSIALLNMNFDVNNSAGSGNTKDYSTYSNNGTVSGATWSSSAGWNGTGAYSFDKNTAHIDYAASDFANLGSLTVMAWINANSFDTSKIIVAKDADSGGRTFTLDFHDSDVIRFYVNGGADGDIISSSSTYGTGWIHVAGVYNTAGTLDLYVNGQSAATQVTNVITSLPSSTANVTIGRRDYTGFNDPFDGYIDEVKIFNHSLAANQIFALYNNRSDLIVSDETSIGENWSVCVTPNDGTEDGTGVCSNDVEIQEPVNSAPVIGSLMLNATDNPENTSVANLTAYVTVSDDDGDDIGYAWDWRKENMSIAVLNMNFDVNNSAGSGKTKDYSTYSNNGTLGTSTAEPTWSATGGWNGTGAYDFDGNDWINLSNKPSLNIAGDQITIAAWVKWDTFPSASNTGRVIVRKDGQYILYIYDSDGTAGNRNLYFYLYSGVMPGGLSDAPKYQSSNLNTGQWYHVAGTYNGSIAKLFVDGSLVDSQSLSGNIGSGINNAMLGSNSDGSEYHHDGVIDNALILDRALSDSEIMALAENKSHILTSDETTIGENWSVCVTPNDGTVDGAEACSNELEIQNSEPEVSSVVLNATDNPDNTTNANLTAWVTASDADGDSISLSYNWMKNGRSWPATANVTNWSNIVLFMPFENYTQSSDAYKDWSVNGNDGAVSGASWNATGGHDGYGAYDFDGSSGYINIPDTDELSFGDGATDDPFSISAWIKHQGSSTGAIVVKGEYTTSWTREYGLFSTSTVGLNSLVSVSDDSGKKRAYSGVSLIDNTWHHVVSTYSGTGYPILYVDGVRVSTTNETIGTYTAMSNTDSALQIGRQRSDSGDNVYFNGSIDEVKIFNHSLSAEQILNLFNNRSDLIVSDETTIGENWSVCVTPNDGTVDGAEACSNELEIQNSAPEVSSVVLNATDNPDNTTNANLTGYVTGTDGDDDNIGYAWDWRKENTSIAVLNMNFDVEDSAGSGETKDYTTYSNNGTVSGATWSSSGGWNGTGVYTFNGSGQYIDAGSNPITGTDAFTLAAWINTTTVTEYSGAVMIGNSASTEGAYIGTVATAQQGTSNSIGGGFYGENYGSGLTTTGAWVHVAFTFSGGASGTATLYINGEPNTTSTYTPNLGSTYMRIGRIGSDTAYDFSGAIDNVLIADRALSAAQISALYNNRSDLIVSDETSLGENWSVCVTPNDGAVDGAEACSNEIEIQSGNSAPYGSVSINATDNPLNTTAANLTANVSLTDDEGDDIRVWYDWRVDNESIAVLYLPLDDAASGGIVEGYSTQKTNGTVSGTPTYTSSGCFNNTGCYEFTGTSGQEINMTGLAVNTSAGAYTTVTFWMNWDGATNRMPFGWDNNYDLFFNSGCFGFNSGNSDLLGVSSTGLNDKWVHVAAVFYNGVPSTSTTKLYLDGVQQSLTTCAGTHISQSVSTTAYLSGWGYDNGYKFDGHLDELRIYDRELSAEQIALIAANNSYIVVSNETTNGENWSLCLTPNDGTVDGAEVCSNEMEIENSAPYGSVTINATDNPDNTTDANLTAYVTSSDTDGDNIGYAWDWRKENTSIAVLNMNFDVEDSAGSGKTKDYSTYSNNGTVSGATWNATGGWNGTGAYIFDNTSAYVVVDDDASLDFSSALTIEAWFTPSSLPSSPHCDHIVHKDAETSGSPYWGRIYALSFCSDAHVLGYFITASGSQSLSCNTTVLQTGNWYHAVVTFNGTESRCYLDGELENSKVFSETTLSSSNGRLFIGAGRLDNGDGDEFLDGVIDTVKIYDVALSSQQITALYNNRSDLIVSDETSAGENWSVCVTPNDGTVDGTEACSNELEIQNSAPEVSSVILNATDNPDNTTNANLTAHLAASDADGDYISYAYDWRLENTSIAVLNMNFDVEDSAGSGKTKDYSTYSNNGTVTNAVWDSTGGWNGTGAFEFDNNGDYISIGGTNSLNFENQGVTFAAWINPDSYAAGSSPDWVDAIITKSADSGDGALILDLYGDGASSCARNIQFKFRHSSTATAGCSATEIPLNSWTHVAGTYDGTNLKVYVNGSLENTTYVGDAVASNTGDVTIGWKGTFTSSAYYFDGHIDEAIILDRALSADQIAALYNNRSDLIVSDETSAGENWSVCVTPNDGTEDGAETCSNEVEIQEVTNSAPNGSVTINATDRPSNKTNANLTAWPVFSDDDGDNISYAWDWRRDNVSIAVLNLNFDIEESAGTGKTKDYSKYGNNGSITNAVWNATGGWNNTGGYYFDNTISYITAGQLPELVGSSTMSISFWMNARYLPTVSGENAGLVIQHDDFDNQFGVRFDGNGQKIVAYVESGGTDSAASALYVGNVSENTWHHITFTFNAGDARLYIDGDLKSNGSSATTTIPDLTQDMYIGGLYNSNGDDYFSGHLDEVRIYNRTLSAAQILALYNNRSDLIVSDETSAGENWSVCVTPNDGTVDGTEACSNELEIQNSAPEVSSVILNATDNPDNTTNANLTAHLAASDADGDNISYAYDWRKENVSIAVLNMNFDVDDSAGSGKTKDYSTYSNNGTITNAVWCASCGWNNSGAYNFTASESSISISETDIETHTTGTISAWVYPTGSGRRNIFTLSHTGSTNYYVQFSLNSTNGLEGYARTSSSSNYVSFSGGVLSTDTWHHVAWVNNGTTYTSYIDGVDTTGTVTENGVSEGAWFDDVASNADTALIGALERSDGINGEFLGVIDTVFISEEVLSAEQISALYNNRSDLIVSDETSEGENWSVCVTPNDGTVDGSMACSDELEIQEAANEVPVVNSFILNATDNPLNTSQANLTTHINVTDPEGGDVNVNYRWFKNNRSWPASANVTAYANLALNMPFENYTQASDSYKDWSLYSSTVSVDSATWNATGGHDGYGAYEFDGVSGEIGVYNATGGNYTKDIETQSFSIAGWLKVNDITASSYMISKHGATLSSSNYFLRYSPSGCSGDYSNKFSFSVNSGSTPYHRFSDTTYTDTGWHYLVAVYDGSNMSLYVDGQLDNGLLERDSCASASVPATRNLNAEYATRIGSSYTTTLNGSVDDVQIYNVALTGTQVAALYNNQTSFITSGETAVGETWHSCATPNDGVQNGVESCTNTVSIQNALSSISALVLNATDNPLNTTNANLTAYVTGTDGDDDNIGYAWDWRKENVSIAVLNMNFDVNNSAGSGKTKDYSTYSNNGTVSGATWNATGGWNGTGAYAFDGSNYVDVPEEDFATSEQGALAAWINPSGSGSGEIFSYTDTDSDNYFVSFRLNDSDYLGLKIRTSSSSSQVEVMSTSALGSGFSHIAFVNNGSYQLYIDGVDVTGTVTENGLFEGAWFDDVASQADEAKIGVRHRLNGPFINYYSGVIDELSIYNTPLSPAQVAALANNRSDLIVSDETTAGENWSVCVTPNDGTVDGAEACSNELEIQNSEPEVSSVILNATDNPDNTTNANLTAYVTGTDGDDDNIGYAWDWRKENMSIAVLNMNFDVEDSAGSGKTKDYSTYSNNGTLGTSTAEPTWSATGGWNGTGAYEFDGINDYISMGDVNEVDGLSTMSVGAWIKPGNNNYGAGTYIAVKEDSWYLYVDPNERVGFAIHGSSGTTYPIPSIDEWHYLVAVYNSTHELIYLDGSLVNSSSSVAMPSSGYPLSIGARDQDGSGWDDFYNGTIDSIDIWNSALSAAQISALFNNRSDLIVSDETSAGENWSVCVTPNDGTADGTEACSNEIEIQAPAEGCQGATTLFGCGDTITESCTMVSNLQCSGTAFRIGADSLTIDGAGFMVLGDGSGYAFNNTVQYDFLTIRDFLISNFSYGVYAANSDNVTIFNNTFNVSDEGLSFWVSSYNATISKNVIRTIGFSSYGIRMPTGSDNIITYNTVESNSTVGTGINIGNSPRLILAHNTINASGIFNGVFFAGVNATIVNNTIDVGDYGIYSSSDPHNTTVTGNYVKANDHAIYIDGDDISITHNMIVPDASSYGVYLNGADIERAYVYNNSIIGSSTGMGVYILGAVDTTVSNNRINTKNDGIYLTSTADNTNITNNNITTDTNSGAFGINLDNARDATIMNNNINTSSSSSYGIYLNGNDVLRTLIKSNTIVTSDDYGTYHNADVNTTLYNNTFSTVDDAIYINNNPTNLNITANNITTHSNTWAIGINVNSGTDLLIQRNAIATSTSGSRGINLNGNGVIRPRILSNTLSPTASVDAVYVLQSVNVTLWNNTFLSTGSSAIYVQDAPYTNITGNYIDGSYGEGIRLYSSADAVIERNDITISANTAALAVDGGTATDNIRALIKQNNITMQGSGRGLLLEGTNITAEDNTITTASNAGIYLQLAGTENVTLKRNTILAGGTDLVIATSSLNGTILHDQPIGSYDFAGNNQITIINSTFGIVEYIGGVTESGTDLNADIFIGDNLVDVSDSKAGLDQPANITLFGVPTSFSNPKILRNGYNCDESICTNLTSINQSTVKFNVTGFTNYSIGEDNPLVGCQGATTLFQCGDTITESCTMVGNLQCSGTAFTIGANSITVNGADLSLTGNQSGYAFDNTGGYDSVVFQNLNLQNFSNGIGLTNADTVKILNSTINTTDDAIIVTSSDDLNITGNTIQTHTNTLAYAINVVSGDDLIVDQNTILTSTAGSYGLYLDGSDVPRPKITSNNITVSYSSARAIQSNSVADMIVSDNTIIAGKHGIYHSGDNVNITNNKVNTTGDTFAHAVYILSGSSPHVERNTVYTLMGSSMGIFFSGSDVTDGKILSNTLSGNAGSSYLISLSGASDNLVWNNTLTAVATPGIALLSDASNNIISYNDITSSGFMADSILLSETNDTLIEWNTISSSSSSASMIVLASSDVRTIIRSNELSMSSSGNGVYSTTSINATVWNNNITAGTGIRAISNTQNMNITQNDFDTSGYGISLESAIDSIIDRNTILSDYFALSMSSSSVQRANINSNTITTTGSGDYGVSMSAAVNITLWNNTFTTADDGILIDGSASGVNISQNRIATSATANAHGINLASATSPTISENNISTVTSGSYALYVDGSDVTSPFIERNNLSTSASGTYALVLNGPSSATVTDNNISAIAPAVLVSGSASSTTIQQNNITTSTNAAAHGILVTSASGTTIQQNDITTSTSGSYALNITGGTSLTVDANTLTSIAGGAFAIGGTPTATNLSSNTLSVAGYELFVFENGANGTILYNQAIGNYSLAGDNTLTKTNTTHGTVAYIGGISGNGANLDNDIALSNNLVDVTDSQAGLDAAAEITLYSVPTSFSNPAILRDGFTCDASICTNLTPLNQSTVRFNVTGFSNYTIGEDNPVTGCQGQNYLFACGDTINESCTMVAGLTCDGDAFSIGAADIIVNGAGLSLLSNASGTAFNNTAGYDNVVIANFTMDNFTYGVLFDGVDNSRIENNTISTVDDAISIDTSDYVNITDNDVSTNTNTGAYGLYIQASSDFIRVEGNTLRTVTSSSDACYVTSSNNVSFIDNDVFTASTTSSRGVYFTNSDNGSVLRNRFMTNSSAVYAQNRNIIVIENNITTNGNGATYGVGGSTPSSIIIERNNIHSLPGSGSTISLISTSSGAIIRHNKLTSSSTSGYGMNLQAQTGGLVYNNTIRTVDYGIYLSSSSNMSILNNNITTENETSADGISMGFADNNTFENNIIRTTTSGSIGIDQGALSDGSIIRNNTIITDLAYGIYSTGTYATVENNNISSGGSGIYFRSSSLGFNISNNTITTHTNSNADGIYVGQGIGSRIINNTITTATSDSEGINLNGNDVLDTLIEKNTISSYDAGIYGSSSINTMILNNSITSTNDRGIDSVGLDNTTISNNTITANGVGLYFTTNPINITITGNNITTSTATSAHGIDISNGNYITIVNNLINTTTSSSLGIDIDGIDDQAATVAHNTIITSGSSANGVAIYDLPGTEVWNNTLEVSGVGIYVGTEYIHVHNNEISSSIGGGSDGFGIYASHALIENNSLTRSSTWGDGFYLSNADNVTIRNNNITTQGINGHGFYINSGTNGTISDNRITTTNGDGFYFHSGGTNVIANLSRNILSIGGSYVDLDADPSGNDNITLYDQPIGSYELNNIALTIHNSTYGIVRYLSGVTQTGTDLSSDILISDNLVDVSDSQAGLDQPANITLFNVPVFTEPVILRDGALCADCYNFTALVGTVKFNVTGFSNYSIGENPIECVIDADCPTGKACYFNYCFSDHGMWILQNATQNVSWVDSFGRMMIAGTASTSQGSCSGQFPIQTGGAIVGAVDKNGNLCLTGSLSQTQSLPLTPPVGGGLLIRNGTGVVVSYVDTSGNMLLGLDLVESGFS